MLQRLGNCCSGFNLVFNGSDLGGTVGGSCCNVLGMVLCIDGWDIALERFGDFADMLHDFVVTVGQSCFKGLDVMS